MQDAACKMQNTRSTSSSPSPSPSSSSSHGGDGEGGKPPFFSKREVPSRRETGGSAESPRNFPPEKDVREVSVWWSCPDLANSRS
ncbi:hypothetical protein QTJ16_006830 [Diplocarpon rosae]|uniref:Uncharacterized protein n=1 Tax=Diplocarpon rosae TaxID=946125 RepID=A0AAD9SVD5_9HELO|nr:hypothetical protein QTJ16_006830 [Diplocarpon rosae]